MNDYIKNIHYATFIALIVSNVTVFGLAMLLSHSMLGGGLNYFAEIRAEGEIQKALAGGKAFQRGQGSGHSRSEKNPLLNNPSYDPIAQVFNPGSTASGEVNWAYAKGANGIDDGIAVAMSRNGDIALTGSFQNSVDFGGGSLQSAGSGDIFIAKYDSSGQHIWSRRFGGTAHESGDSIAMDKDGNVIITGKFSNSLDLGGVTALTSNGDTDIYLAKYDSQSGSHLFSRGIGGANSEWGADVAADQDGNIVLTGMFKGINVNFGGVTLWSDLSAEDLFVAKYSSDGQTLHWVRSAVSYAPDYGDVVTIDHEGNVIASGHFTHNLTFDTFSLTNTDTRFFDVYVVKLNGDTGAAMWASSGGSTYDDDVFDVAVDTSGNVVIVGEYTSTANFGGVELPNAGQGDAFVVKYDGVTGAHEWSRGFGGNGLEKATGVAADSAGNVVVTGDFEAVSSVDFGGGSLASAGSNDIFLAKYNAQTGAHMWSERYGDGSSDLPRKLSRAEPVRRTDEPPFSMPTPIVGTGLFIGSIDFGSYTVNSAGVYDIFFYSVEP